MGAKARAFLDPPTYTERVQRLPCCVCRRRIGHTYGPAEAAHVKSRGAGGGEVGNLVPLCHHHHERQHRMGIKSFQAHYGVNLALEAERVRQYVEANDVRES